MNGWKTNQSMNQPISHKSFLPTQESIRRSTENEIFLMKIQRNGSIKRSFDEEKNESMKNKIWKEVEVEQ